MQFHLKEKDVWIAERRDIFSFLNFAINVSYFIKDLLIGLPRSCLLFRAPKALATAR
jgi:hypothetical protein